MLTPRAGSVPHDEHGTALPLKYRAAVIVLPSDFDFQWWLEMCGQADQEAHHLVEVHHGRGVLGASERMRTEVTYPQLVGVRDVRWVYLAWRNMIRVRQQASSVTVMKPAYLPPDMLPEYRDLFKLGKPYQYVFAEWERVPQQIVPYLERMPSPWAHRIVHLATTVAEEFPTW